MARPHAHIHIVHARGDQKRQVRIATAHFGEQFHTTDVGDVKVGNARVELPALQSRERFLAIAGGGAPKRGRSEDERL